jgi:hypothetical protein
MRTLHRTALAAAIVVVVGGCSEFKALEYTLGVTPPAPAPVTGPPPEGSIALQPLAPVRRDIFTRSYRIGEPYTVHTGDPVVSIKNYSITERVGRATVLRDFQQQCRRTWPPKAKTGPCSDAPLDAVRGAMGSVFDVIGAVTLPDGQYFAISPPRTGSSQVYILADPTGRLRTGAYVAWREDLTPGTTLGHVPLVELQPDLALDSSTPLFSYESVEKFVPMGPGYLSFDLIFLGTRDTPRGELMNFLYREYGRDSTNKAAFERTLQFSTKQPVIEVDRLRIEVQPAGYNDLRFRVISDGQPAPPAK